MIAQQAETRKIAVQLGLVVDNPHRNWLDWIYFTLRSKDPITLELARMEQGRAGYLVQGYGFDSFNHSWDELHGHWVATWRCSNSCE